jgi:hypothetical protein
MARILMRRSTDRGVCSVNRGFAQVNRDAKGCPPCLCELPKLLTDLSDVGQGIYPRPVLRQVAPA